MPGDEQERFEDYLEIEQFIEKLRAGQVAHPPHELTPEQARIYRMAVLFHSATPGVSEPQPDFVAQLKSRLEEDFQNQKKASGSDEFVARSRLRSSTARVSRRALLAGGVAVAASVAAGAGIEHVAEQATDKDDLTASDNSNATDWFFVTTVDEMGDQAVQFRTESLVGYVVRSTDGASKQGEIIAMSAACTHMGCIVKWSGEDRKFHCPCHNGTFLEDGGTESGASARLYLNPLPRLEAKETDGKVYVRVPTSRG